MGSDTRARTDAPAGGPPRALAHAPLIVVSGPSGVGKTTLVTRLLAQTSLPLRRAITATSRPARPGERPETDYHFWSRADFEAAIAAGDMLEHAVVFGRDYYGTPRSEVEPYLARGEGVIVVPDVQGAASLRAMFRGDLLSVFIEPPSFEELEARLRGRKDMPEESVRRRAAAARGEVERAHEFDHRIINQDLETATRELEGVILARFPNPKGATCSTS
ncbi:guanylate kinase [Gemmata sp.]|uniref:guanylate kinase n=1 Tax=Gemmata sp. TaxID=1914242 RepID=UPI003F6FB488